MTLDQSHDTSLGHGQQLCEILSRSNMAVRSFGPDTDFGYVCPFLPTLACHNRQLEVYIIRFEVYNRQFEPYNRHYKKEKGK